MSASIKTRPGQNEAMSLGTNMFVFDNFTAVITLFFHNKKYSIKGMV